MKEKVRNFIDIVIILAFVTIFVLSFVVIFQNAGHKETRWAILTTPYGEVVEGECTVEKYDAQTVTVKIENIEYTVFYGQILLCSENPDKYPCE